VWKIDRRGRVSEYHLGIGGHWMCLDPQGSFSRTQPRHFGRITPSGVIPALIVADGGAPIAVGRDGNLYYGSGTSPRDEMSPGALTVTRMSPDGKRTLFSPSLKTMLERLEDGVTGLAVGRDGSLYVACVTALLKVQMDGTVTTLAHPIAVAECDRDGDGRVPFLRGLDVDADGTVYAAATGCRCVVKISPNGQTQTVLRAERPWSPTGVALHRGVVYVLEYTHANGGPDEGWLPRVRKLERNGRVTTLATITRQIIKPRERQSR
jgi:hypothetical protein